jgi:hypothetical protein
MLVQLSGATIPGADYPQAAPAACMPGHARREIPRWRSGSGSVRWAELITLAELAAAGQRLALFDPMDGIVL